MSGRNWLLCSVAALPLVVLPSPAQGQSLTLAPPPIRQSVDQDGVDLLSGQIAVPSSSIAIGGDDGLVHTRSRVENGWRHNYLISLEIEQGQSQAFLNIGGVRQVFTWDGTTYASNQKNGETITADFTTGTHTYTARDGTQVILKESYVTAGQSYYGPADALGETIIAPDGKRTTLHYVNDYYETQLPGGQMYSIYVVRLQSVTTNTGYQLHFDYTTDNPSAPDAWYEVFRVTAINNAVEYCDPVASSCGLSNVWPFLQYTKSTSGSSTLETVTDVLGRQARFRTDPSKRLTGIKRPSDNSDGVVIAYDQSSRVSSITHEGSYTRTYAWTESGAYLHGTSTDALGRVHKSQADTVNHRLMNVRDAFDNRTSYGIGLYGRVISIKSPEGDQTVFGYDARGNVTSVTKKAKLNSGLADIVTTASYPTACSNPVTCNKPTSVTDARGKVTNYTYDPIHGGVTSVKSPADRSGIRPETRIAYVSRNARVKNAAGQMIVVSDAVVRPSSIKRCRTTASCSGSADEQVIAFAYNNQLVPNLQPTAVTRKAGNGTLAATTTFAFSDLGNVLTVDGPLSGTADQTRNRYDDAGQLVGFVGADPGTGTLDKRLARRFTYNADGDVTVSETGTVESLSDTDWAAFAPETKVVTAYDKFGRVETIAQVATSGSTQYSVTQYGYDAAGRFECVAQRMNAPTIQTALPADACTPMTAGSYGPDRIGRNVYDAADRLTQQWLGVGTALEHQAFEAAYTDNGLVQWVEDANGNRTEYLHDGHDRTVKIAYPSEGTPHQADPTDYEQFTYDDAGNVLTRRTRAGETFTYTYDDLGRLTRKIVPSRVGLSPAHTRDVYYGYDLFGGLTYARFDSHTGGDKLLFDYDALGRLVSSTQSFDSINRTLSHQYDVVGRRTRLTYPDGAWWKYEWNPANRLVTIRDDDAHWLVIRQFHAGGQLSRTVRDGSAPEDYYYYDAARRLEEVRLDHANASWDVRRPVIFNPANQTATETTINTTYAWDDHPQATVEVDYEANGLNQITQAGTRTLTYDANGNLTSDGETSYVYDTGNRLVATSGAFTSQLQYDPLGRLYEVGDGSGGVRRLLYDGDALVAEYSGTGAMLDRYIHGAGAGDDPLIRYPSAATAYTAAEHLYADRRGSIYASFDRSGAAKAINSYDEYGVSGDSSGIYNTGRFGYTGQAWVPEAGLYYYKARMYSPSLGRFMQTDPIGYADGMNMYAYVGNDPVNAVDPTGLANDEILVQGLKDRLVLMNAARDLAMTMFDIQSAGNTNEILVLGFRNRRGAVASRPIQAGQGAPQKDTSDRCKTRMQKAGDGLEVGGDALIYPGLVLAAAGLAVGPEGAAPGLAIAELGGLAGTAGQVVQDINHGEAGTTIVLRAGANALLGRVAVRGLRMLNGGRAATVIDDVFGQGIGKGVASVVEWLDPQRCP